MNQYQIKEGFDQMDLGAIHKYLSEESYWATNISFSMVSQALSNSFCVGVFSGEMQVGFARLITDYATFAYLADVYILEEHRGQGLSKQLMSYIMNVPWIGGIRRIMLATKDAHGLYTQFGFTAPLKPQSLMEIKRADTYAG